jgi:hypothetical protein
MTPNVAEVAPLTAQSRVLVAVAALLALGVVLELVRRRRLQERYVVLWVFASLTLLGICAFPGTIGTVVSLAGARQAGAGLIGIVFLLLFAFALHTTIAISRLSEQVTRLAQELAVEKARQQDRAVERANRRAEIDPRPPSGSRGRWAKRDEPIGGDVPAHDQPSSIQSS